MSALSQIFDPAPLYTRAEPLLALVGDYLSSLDFLIQIGVLAITGLLAWLLGPRLFHVANQRLPGGDAGWRRTILTILGKVAVSGLWLVFAWFALQIAQGAELSQQTLRVAVNLLAAWVTIRGLSQIIRDSFWSNFVFVAAWAAAALNIIGALDTVLAELNAFGVTLGDTRISGLTVLRGAIALSLLLWAAMGASRFLAGRIEQIQSLSPTLKILLTKILQGVLLIFAVLIALQIMNIPLTLFAVFGGALGVGIGLGLQGAASNIIAGFTLLLDKSIKPGDVVAVDGTFGQVTSLGERYVAVHTRDGIDHLLPNESFIGSGVENWSHGDKNVRLKLPFGVAYASDPHQVRQICHDAAAKIDRVLKDPMPNCLLMGFGDSAIDFELRIWINDPENGVSNVKSAVYFEIWDAFKAAGIEIPFPQQDLNLRSPVKVTLTQDD